MTAIMCPDEQGPRLLPISGENAPSEILVQPTPVQVRCRDLNPEPAD